MATNFPTSLDSFTNPSASDAMDSVTVPHADQHADLNDAVEAIETALLDGAPLKIDDANNRVGIGTTSPRGVLDVNSQEDVYLTSNTSQQGTQDTIIGGHVFLIPYGSGNTSYLQARRGDTSGSTEMVLRTTNSGVIDDNLKIDSAGRVTTPNQPMFSAYGSVGYQALSGGDHTLQFNTTAFNVGNYFDTSTYRFNAPVSGYYFFSLSARIDGLSSASGYYRWQIVRNNTTSYNAPNLHSIRGATNVATNYHTKSVSGIMYLSQADYASVVFTNQGSISSGFLRAESNFTGFLVG